MDLQRILHSSSCQANINAQHKDDVLQTLADLIMKNPDAAGIDRNTLLEKLHEREDQGSTGVEHQIAIPHARVPGLSRFVVALATSAHGVDYDSIDGKKARLFVVILAPEGEAAAHLRILAHVLRILSLPGVRSEMLAAPTSLALYEAFISHSVPVDLSAAFQKEKMNLLTLVLFDQDLIYDILEMLLEEGIEGANIADSFGMGEYISNVPLFAGFLGFMNDRTNRSKTIQALIPGSAINRIIEEIESITGDLDKTQGAALFVTPVTHWKGTMKMM